MNCIATRPRTENRVSPGPVPVRDGRRRRAGPDRTSPARAGTLTSFKKWRTRNVTHPHTTRLGARRFGSRSALAALAILLAPLAQACSDEETGPDTPTYVTDARLVGQDDAAALRNAFLPEGTAEGPTVTVEETSTIINGGSLQVPITASAEFEQLRIGVTTVEDPDATSIPAEPGPVRGYYEISMPEPATSATVVLTIAQTLPVGSMVFDVAAVVDGTQGVPSQQTASAVAVGAGDVQISVSWDVDSDVDLHVVDPNGDEIYWDGMTAPSGGVLDLDSNPDCQLDHTKNENVTFTDAPPGEYTVRVDYFNSCDVDQTNYVVTVQVQDQPAEVFNGGLTGDGDFGGEGSGELVTTFTLPE